MEDVINQSHKCGPVATHPKCNHVTEGGGGAVRIWIWVLSNFLQYVFCDFNKAAKNKNINSNKIP